ncbi:AcaB family transcriptional regulator [Cronobacter muytjensii]|uniref:AcaB family transcriptional regulator n=1 Tax=Cronobacter muytjensii TaxID=413501 RepID=UPI003F667A50
MPGTTLFSDIRITLHTRVAARLWVAHPTGMLLCLALLRRLLRAEEADDPWAAHWLKQLRIRLNLIAHLLKQKNRRLDQAFASLPGAIHTTQISNPSPTEFILPLALFSPPGSRLLQQLITICWSAEPCLPGISVLSPRRRSAISLPLSHA